MILSIEICVNLAVIVDPHFISPVHCKRLRYPIKHFKLIQHIHNCITIFRAGFQGKAERTTPLQFDFLHLIRFDCKRMANKAKFPTLILPAQRIANRNRQKQHHYHDNSDGNSLADVIPLFLRTNSGPPWDCFDESSQKVGTAAAVPT